MPDRSKDNKIESSIPEWVVYALLGTVTFLIVNTIHAALLTFIASGVVMLFIWSYLSKPIAEIQPSKEDDDEDSSQMNLFHKNKINRHSFNKNTETNPQRKRYLRSIDDIDNRAA